MAAPVANFTRVVNGLGVDFKDLSSNNPTSWAWNFGDGTTSTDQNPSHTYSADGFFNVTLTATNGDGSSQELSVQISVVATGLAQIRTIHDHITANLPTGVTLDRSNEMQLINKWQLYFHTLVEPNIEQADIYNELAWPPLVNELIGVMVSIDTILQGANAFLMGLGNQDGASGKEVKQITTGPTEAQWFQSSDGWLNIMKEGGLWEQIQAQACYLSANQGIWLPFCPALNINPVVPCKVKTNFRTDFENPLERC